MCDRHNEQKAASGVVIEDTDEHIDLCAECLNEIRSFVGSDHKLEPKRKKSLLDRVKDSVKAE